MEPGQPPPQWMAALDERTNKHVEFARFYARQYAHGAPGHLDLMTIAALAQLLDNFQYRGGAANTPLVGNRPIESGKQESRS